MKKKKKILLTWKLEKKMKIKKCPLTKLTLNFSHDGLRKHKMYSYLAVFCTRANKDVNKCLEDIETE